MKLLLYCTKAEPYITKGTNGSVYPSCVISDGIKEWHLNGKIVAECDFEVEEINNCFYADKFDHFYRESRLTFTQLKKYLQDNKGYAIHIKNLHIFDKPRELSNYITKQCQFGKCSTCKYGKNNIICSTIDTPITKAPQNMMYAFDNEGMECIVISIQPQWLCKILNGEKTIEVRKKVLKEMLNNE